ncbi:MAG: Clostridial binary toxin B/anthrax toxin Ca-binding domain, partial [Thermomicrobiales bacterium]|nr:Clostridial binary toxin B/anthrax toxin Ca-binding domain [Thermomicrobiales bacterium]
SQDTDGDAMNDGAEVIAFGTDPTKSDTDGDGFADGDEVSANKDPNDPNSHP